MAYYTNYWFELYSENRHLLSEKTLHESLNYLKFDGPTSEVGYVNYFWLDGSSERTLWNVLSELLEHRDKLKIPPLDKKAKTLFITCGEGWCNKKLFDTLHGVIDLFGLTGECYYQCCTVNCQELYEKYCEDANIRPRISCIYKNIGFLLSQVSYVFPKSETMISYLPYERKKLFTSLNWNAWPHRMALIGLMHYYDLLKDGYVTSPGASKYAYDLENDYRLLYYVVLDFFEDDPDRDVILDKLPSIKEYYPLVIDDRSTYPDTETAVFDPRYTGPIFEARINSLIEIVPETLYSGEHFFSEKTFWPIALAKPFIMVCGSGSLESLRKIGFKTFSPYIDESYDDEKDGVLRLKKIALEVKRLKELKINDPKTFDENYFKMRDIAIFNRRVFLKYGKLP